jgi:uncharacterized protein (DUF1919 family)
MMKNYTVFWTARGQHMALPFSLAKYAHSYVKWLRRTKAQSINVVRDDDMRLYKIERRSHRAEKLIRQVDKLPFNEAIMFVKREINADFELVWNEHIAAWCVKHSAEIDRLARETRR